MSSAGDLRLDTGNWMLDFEVGRWMLEGFPIPL